MTRTRAGKMVLMGAVVGVVVWGGWSLVGLDWGEWHGRWRGGETQREVEELRHRIAEQSVALAEMRQRLAQLQEDQDRVRRSLLRVTAAVGSSSRALDQVQAVAGDVHRLGQAVARLEKAEWTSRNHAGQVVEASMRLAHSQAMLERQIADLRAGLASVDQSTQAGVIGQSVDPASEGDGKGVMENGVVVVPELELPAP